MVRACAYRISTRLVWNPAPPASRSNQGIDPCPAERLRGALEPGALGGLRGGAGEEIVGLNDEWNAAKGDEQLAGFSEALPRFYLPADRE